MLFSGDEGIANAEFPRQECSSVNWEFRKKSSVRRDGVRSRIREAADHGEDWV